MSRFNMILETLLTIEISYWQQKTLPMTQKPKITKLCFYQFSRRGKPTSHFTIHQLLESSFGALFNLLNFCWQWKVGLPHLMTGQVRPSHLPSQKCIGEWNRNHNPLSRTAVSIGKYTLAPSPDRIVVYRGKSSDFYYTQGIMNFTEGKYCPAFFYVGTKKTRLNSFASPSFSVRVLPSCIGFC